MISYYSFKVCIPIMWHYIPEIKDLEDQKEMFSYIPEGVEDAAKIALDEDTTIKVWKEELKGDKFALQWQPVISEDGRHKITKNSILV